MWNDGSIDDILTAESFSLEVARKLIRAQHGQILELQAILEELIKKNPTERLDE